MTERERFFECVFVCERNEYLFHFRAKTETEAEQHLQETLREHGVTSAGTVLVRNARGELVRRCDYAPDASPDAPA